MSCAEALRRCPQAVFVRPRHAVYREYSRDVWETVRGIVLDGAFYLTRAIIPSMVANNYGRVLFFCGDGAFSGVSHVETPERANP